MGTCLAESCLGREHHIPQHLWVKVGKWPIPHRKGQHIGGTIDTAIAGVQPAHPGIIDDEHTQITALTFKSRE
jgi:hypothetical protein